MSRLGAVHTRYCSSERLAAGACDSAPLGRLHQPVRQGPEEGAGPWRTHPTADATYVGAAVPVTATVPPREDQPALTLPYLATLTEHQGSRSVMWVQGELDMDSQPHLRHAIATALNRNKPRLLVLDLSSLRFVDCAGLRVIVWAHRWQAERASKLVVANAQSAVRRVLRLTSCDDLLHLSPP